MSAPVESSHEASALSEEGSHDASTGETVGSHQSAASAPDSADNTSASAADAEPARVLRLVERQLSRARVEQLASELRGMRGAAPVILDLSVVQGFAPDALAALLELGRTQTGIREVALAGLSRTLTLATVQAGLAERFSIFASADAAALDAGPR